MNSQDEVVARMRREIVRMTREHHRARLQFAVASALAFGGGAYISAEDGQWAWLAFCGALVVGQVGIGFVAWRDLRAAR